MTLREFLASKKSITKIGRWNDKKMPKTGNGFPLSKAKGLRVGGGWHWTIIELQAGKAECRLLVAYHPTKENYLAALGYAVGADTHVIATLEYHSTHPGWHVHGCCLPARTGNIGRARYPDMRRVPSSGKGYHRNTVFGVSESSALEPAIKYFQLRDAFDEMLPLLRTS
jgi:hypothetical protein